MEGRILALQHLHPATQSQLDLLLEDLKESFDSFNTHFANHGTTAPDTGQCGDREGGCCGGEDKTACGGGKETGGCCREETSDEMEGCSAPAQSAEDKSFKSSDMLLELDVISHTKSSSMQSIEDRLKHIIESSGSF